MSQEWERRVFIIITVVVLVAISVPFFIAAQKGGKDYIFGGFLLNPIDGNSYLAKMRQGWEGQWMFVLPYTVEPGQGAYLFIFYIALGQLARFLQIPLLLTFDFARIISTVLMLWLLFRFFQVVLPETRLRIIAFLLAALGSGLGWLVIPFGLFTSDLWVAEAYPFLSAYANPHFPLALALVLWLVTPRKIQRIPPQMGGDFGDNISENSAPLDPRSEIMWIDAPSYVVISFLLALISPFGILVVVIILGGMALWEILIQVQKSGYFQSLRYIILNQDIVQILAILIGGFPVIFYYFIVIRIDPILSGWNAQNVTQSPPLWDLIISLSPALILAFWGAYRIIRRPSVQSRYLLIWGSLGLILIAVPFGLQRRLMMGLFIPISGLAALGIEQIASGKRSRVRNLTLILFLLALPTNLIVLLSGQQGVSTLDPLLYLSQTEMNAFEWLEENTSPEELALAGPETGLFIPAYTGLRVLYGHPFETVNAETQEQIVLRFFQDIQNAGEVEDFLSDQKVDLIFYGPREKEIGALSDLTTSELVFDNRDVQIYSTKK